MHYQLWPRGSPKSTMVKYGQNDVFLYHVKTLLLKSEKNSFVYTNNVLILRHVSLLINTYVGLWHSSLVHSNGFVALGHSWILKFIIPQFLSHIICYHVVRIFFIYIVVWQNKWFKPSTFYIVMWNVMSHCDVYQRLRFIVTLSRVISHYAIKPWFVTVFDWYMSTQPKMWHINNVSMDV